MILCLLMFLIAFVWSWVATTEVYFIARSDPLKATGWAVLNGALSFAMTYLIVLSVSLPLIVPYVAGNALATYIVLARRRRCR